MLKHTMTQGLFAQRHGVTRKTVCEWRARGLVVLAANGEVDVAASEKRLKMRPEKYRGGRARGPSTPATSFDVAVRFGPVPRLDDVFGET